MRINGSPHLDLGVLWRCKAILHVTGDVKNAGQCCHLTLESSTAYLPKTINIINLYSFLRSSRKLKKLYIKQLIRFHSCAQMNEI